MTDVAPAKKNRGLLGILLFVFLIFVLFVIFVFYSMSKILGPKDLGNSSFVLGKDGVALIEVTGVILDSKKTVDELQKAEEASHIKGIIVRIDSPGGAVGPTQEIYEEILRIDQIKPVYASFGSVAASGGYYIGAGARKIYANAGTLTGSIGVIMQFMNLSKLFDFAKISAEVIKAGHYKDMGNPYRGLTPEERRLLDEMLTNVHDRFKSDILRTRKDRLVGDIDRLAQGQIFSGEGAKKLGLVDELGSLWSAGRDLQRELGLRGKLNLIPIKSKSKFSFMDLFEGLEESMSDIKYGIMLNNIPMLIYNP